MGYVNVCRINLRKYCLLFCYSPFTLFVQKILIIAYILFLLSYYYFVEIYLRTYLGKQSKVPVSIYINV